MNELCIAIEKEDFLLKICENPVDDDLFLAISEIDLPNQSLLDLDKLHSLYTESQ